MKACLGSKNRELADVWGSPYENWEEKGNDNGDSLLTPIFLEEIPEGRQPYREREGLALHFC